uniref:Uncharacterized protein n=1 Tax=Ciona intestinalis TaxID=7719 RepID=H2XKI0_CIOIN
MATYSVAGFSMWFLCHIRHVLTGLKHLICGCFSWRFKLCNLIFRLYL